MLSQNVAELTKSMVRLKKVSYKDSDFVQPQLFGLLSVSASVPPLFTVQRKFELNKNMKCGTRKDFMMDKTKNSIPKKNH